MAETDEEHTARPTASTVGRPRTSPRVPATSGVTTPGSRPAPTARWSTVTAVTSSGGDPDAAPYPDGYVDDEPVRTPADEWVRPDRDRRWGAPQPSTPDPQEYGTPSRGDLPWPAPGPLRPSSGRDHREYQRPTPQERDVDRRPGGPPDGAEPERCAARARAAGLRGTRPGSAPRHLSVVPDHPVSPAPERNRPVSPAPESDRPVSPAARAGPARLPRSAAPPAGGRLRATPSRQDRERPAASAAGRHRRGTPSDRHRCTSTRYVPRRCTSTRSVRLHCTISRSSPRHHRHRALGAAAPPVAAPPARPVSAPPTQPPVPAPPRPPTGLRTSPGSHRPPPPPPDRPAAAASATPPPAVPAPPASTPPVSAPAVSQPPVTTPSAGTPPTSAPPVSARRSPELPAARLRCAGLGRAGLDAAGFPADR